ncbi:MAG TPA: tyrosine-type recombinase/integrase [Bryobacteraceae bacterium]
MLTIWRRHSESCPHRDKGRDYLKCNCPLWADGYVNGERTLRQSLKTRDMARARKKAVALEDPRAPLRIPLTTAVDGFLGQCVDLQASTRRKYTNSLTKLTQFCDDRGVDAVADMTTETLDAFRLFRREGSAENDADGIGLRTAEKELQLLRQFMGFCFERRWIDENVAKPIRGPRNIKPNDIEPFSANDLTCILAACDTFGRGAYERIRARSIILLLRFTGLRIGDTAMLARDRVTWDRERGRWRIFLRTEKTGTPVFLPIPNSLKQVLDSVPAPRGAEADPRYYFWNGTTSVRAVKGIAERTLAAVFKESKVQRAHAHRFRHTLATELLGRGASFEDVADILGNSPAIVRKHYAKWSPARQQRIDVLMDGMEAIGMGTNWAQTEKAAVC